jgi:hypothetical protein
MKNSKIDLNADDFDLGEWIKQTRATSRALAKRKNTVPRGPRRSGTLDRVVLIPRFRWTGAHQALLASKQPHEATAVAGGVSVRTTIKGAKALQPYALEGCLTP